MIDVYLFKTAVQDLLRPRRIAVWVAVACLLYGIGRVFDLARPNQPAEGRYAILSSVTVYHLLALAAAIFATSVVNQEVAEKTIVYLLTRPIARWRLLLARTMAAIVVVAMVTWVGAWAVSLATYGPHENPLLLRDMLALSVGAAAYISMFVLLGLLMNRSMIVSLLFAFGWETAVPNMPGDLYRLSISSYLASIAQHPSIPGPKDLIQGLAGMLAVNTISKNTAWMVLTLIVVLCLGVGCWWFTHFEYVPREDSE